MKQKYRQSETWTVKRSQIKFAPYNPKKHTAEQVAEIKRNVKRVAFLGGIVWNTATGNLIDGHKRLMALDALNDYDGTPEKDYDVKVEVIELDEKTEKEQNLFQTTSRTALDSLLVAELLPGLDTAFTGLSDEDLEVIAVEVPNFDYGEEPSGANDFARMHAEQKQRAETEREIKKQSNAVASGLDPEHERQQRIDAVKEAKQQAKSTNEGVPHVTLTFNDFEAKAYFMEQWGYDQYDQFIKGESFAEKIGG